MDCQKIESIISSLSVNKIGSIRGKGRVIDKIHLEHLKKLDSELMDIRVYVAKLSTGYSSSEVLKMVDHFIYQKQIS